MSMIDFELYKLFYTVAKYGSLSKAAEELFISQPAASQSIKRLEELLDTPLFNRMHHGMELSAQGGKIIFDDVEQAIKLLYGVEQTECDRHDTHRCFGDNFSIHSVRENR